MIGFRLNFIYIISGYLFEVGVVCNLIFVLTFSCLDFCWCWFWHHKKIWSLLCSNHGPRDQFLSRFRCSDSVFFKIQIPGMKLKIENVKNYRNHCCIEHIEVKIQETPSRIRCSIQISIKQTTQLFNMTLFLCCRYRTNVWYAWKYTNK